MCGRFVRQYIRGQLLVAFEQRFHQKLLDKVSQYLEKLKDTDIRPTDMVDVVAYKNGEFYLAPMKWGFSLQNIPRPMINSKIEEVVSGKSAEYWQSLLQENPCIVPMTGYYEWKELGKKGSKTLKEPYKFTLQNEEVFFAAGYYRKEYDSAGKAYYAVTIITTIGNDITRPIHTKDRMPILLTLDSGYKYLTGDLHERIELCVPYPAEAMECLAESP
jgi:putative SOS response-associated peptidase YedK